MTPPPLLPLPDAIPAPGWLFHLLEVALFTLHMLLVNMLLGGSLILLVARLWRRGEAVSAPVSALGKKIPIIFALAVNMGVAPLLFLQVTHGHLFYTSSILMGAFWILIIPLVILAYYAAYIHARTARPALAIGAVTLTVLVLLTIAFLLVNNMLLMMQPAAWSAYYSHRGGNFLHLSDPTLIPRYLHFVVASVAIAGLFSAVVWSVRERRGQPGGRENVKQGLLLFAGATFIQFVTGLVFLGLLPQDFLPLFIGGNSAATLTLTVGLLSAFGAVGAAFLGKLRPTLAMALVTIVAMVLARDQLRAMYLQGSFDPSSLAVAPQDGVMTLFFIVLLIGLASIAWMLKAGFGNAGRTTP